MSKAELHRQLDELIPATTVSRSNLRIIGHALIELGLLTSMECGWVHCRQSTRAFEPYGPEGTGQARHPRVPSVDHVTSRSDGGSDLPSNIQIIHFACNAAKGSLDARKNPDIQKKMSEALARRWKDPSYRAKMQEAARRTHGSETTRQSKSDKMKELWRNPEHRAKIDAARKKRAESQPQKCSQCGKVCKSSQGLTLHVRNQHTETE